MPRSTAVRTVALTLSAAALAFAANAQQTKKLELTAGINVVRAEVAATFGERAQGLMNREKMAPNEGMLFVFAEVERPCMWMKNTMLPLSVAFIDEKGAIINVEEMAPQTENSHCATADARYALEMNAAWFKKHGLGAGTKIKGLEKAPAPQ